MMHTAEDVLDFWFPEGLGRDRETHFERMKWWFRGGADAEVKAGGGALFEAALAGRCDDWVEAPRSCLALILVLDQFPRSLFKNDARMYSGDEKAVRTTREGLARGFYERLAHVWEQLFFTLPYGHSESLELQEESVRFSRSAVDRAPPHLVELYRFSASQAEGHRDTIARFGRQPHRNPILGRESTPEELEYIQAGSFVHQRSIPK
jgi:uncharacterized protein (DUF924 family)